MGHTSTISFFFNCRRNLYSPYKNASRTLLSSPHFHDSLSVDLEAENILICLRGSNNYQFARLRQLLKLDDSATIEVERCNVIDTTNATNLNL